MRIPRYQRKAGAPADLPNAQLAARPYLPDAPGPEAFGAGVGRALAQAGHRLEQVAERMQAEEDSTRVVEAQNALSAWEREFFNNPETGIFSKKNKDAVGLYDEAAKVYEEKVREVSGTLGNDRQRMAFSRSASSSMNAKLDAAARHEAAQRQNWMVETAKQTMSIKLDDIMANYTDEGIVTAAIADVRSSIEAMFPGMGGAFVDTATARFVSSAHLARIEAALKAGDPDLALAIFDANEEAIDGTKRAAVKADIDQAQMLRWTQEESEAVWRRFGLKGEEAALKHIRETYEGDRESKLMTAVQARYVDEKRIQAKRESDAYDALYDRVASAGSYGEALSAIERSGLKRRQRDGLKRLAEETFGVEARLPKTDPEAAMEIQGHLDNRDLFKAYPTWRQFYAEFGDKLSHAERNRYNAMYQEAEKGTPPAVVYSVQSGMNKLLDDAEIKSQKERVRFVESAQSHLAYEERRLGRPLSASEQMDLLEGLTKKHLLERKSWWIDPKAPGYTIPPGYEFNETFNQQVRVDEDGVVWDLSGMPIGRYREE